MPYFRRAGHVGLLIAASFFYALPGIVYWLARRKHLICPRCGLDWEHSSRALAVSGPDSAGHLIEQEPDNQLPSGGLKRRILGATLALAATLLVLIGFVEWEPVAVAVGSVFGAGGSLTFYWGWQGLQERRKAIMQGLQRKVLKLASMKGGTLTVTEVAADLNIAIPAAEKLLTAMDDGFRVRSDISNEGVIYYEFPELRHRREIGPGD
jgi:hypothetical protein